MKIENHVIKDIEFEKSPNHGGVLNPDTIVIHYTAGPTAVSAIRTLIDPDRKASAHLVVDLDGSTTQLVPFNKIAWHAGKSTHENRIGLNKYSVGIEIVNAGRLKKSGETYFSWFGRKYLPEDTLFAPHRNENVPTYWHIYTEKQILKVEEICTALFQKYKMQYILGHEEISPTRKIDPGPAFPLDKMRNRVLNLQPRDEDVAEELQKIPSKGRVTASRLNIRSNPSSSQEKVAKALLRGKKVKILKKSNGWYKISTEIEGWVASKYISEE